MVAHALQRHVLAVEQKASISSEFDGADAEGRFAAIDHVPVNADFGNHAIQTGGFDRPEPRGLDLERLLELAAAPELSAVRDHPGCFVLRDLLAIGIEDRGGQRQQDPCPSVEDAVLDVRTDADLGRGGRDFRRGHIDSPIRYVQ